MKEPEPAVKTRGYFRGIGSFTSIRSQSSDELTCSLDFRNCNNDAVEVIGEQGKFSISINDEKDINCETFVSETDDDQIEFCVPVSDGPHWYGSGEQYYQPWPLETRLRADSAHLPGDMLQSKEIYASEITAHGFLNSHLEIDDDWETCYGDLRFNPVKFPNVSSMVQDLNNMGLIAGYLDVTNREAIDWWLGRLRTLLDETGIDNYKIDAGETNWLPRNYDLNADNSTVPQIFTTKYAQMAQELSGTSGLLEARVGRRSQDLSIFVRELFIRWLQVNVFMPSIQFSYVPWDYDQETVEISKEMAALVARPNG
ncbi:unnamed protein product [Cyprideis torosa]|uniref:Uncharacterized protein n=1 Tax=Cyprideis torosa TaxID=163714 RepID=A0A7R8W045_9CRUS|nr:unnamed protein product [Cyprideis torosa]CAG0879183.1 unnamed protein product [Cyprideis torosa]